MATMKVRYLVKLGGAGGVPRYFWQPSSKLRGEGWRPQRVPDNWASYSDLAQLEAAAIVKARELNDHMDAAREGRAAAAAPLPIGSALTVQELVTRYCASQAFLGLEDTTKKGYRQCLDRIVAWAADAPIAAITTPRIDRLREGMGKTPAFANAVVRVLRLLFEFARRSGWLAVNPALRPRLKAAPPSGLIWPREAVLRFVRVADEIGRSSIGTAVMLNEWIGQREGDVLRMPRGAYRDGKLMVRQSKTGAGVALPIDMVPHLARRIDDELARHASAARKVSETTIAVSEETGRAYKGDNFRHLFSEIRAKAADAMRREKGWRQLEDGSWWHDELAAHLHNLPTTERRQRMAEEARRAASFQVDYLLPGRDMDDPDAFLIAMEDLWFMHLRHTAVTRLAEVGCEIPLIAAVTGHSHKSVMTILERYLVRTAALARAAFQKRLDAEPAAAPSSENGARPKL